VYSPVSLVCRFHDSDHRPINMGIHRELFFESYRYSTNDRRASAPRLTYDEAVLAQRYRDLTDAEPHLTVRTGVGVYRAEVSGQRLESVQLDDGSRITAPVWVDGTADGNLAKFAGCSVMKGRSSDGALQSATLVFTMGNIAVDHLRIPEFRTRGGLHSLWAEMSEIYRAAKSEGATDNPRDSVLCFPYPDGERLLFNSNEVLGVDPTKKGAVDAALETGRRLVDELVGILRRHPAFAEATLEGVATKMGIREGRRVVGDHILTEDECLAEIRFPDMVAACAYEIDIHDPEGGPARMINIPGSGYYHIPLRCLIARDLENLALGSRCISGTHEAHSSYRVMSGVSAIGQAAGTAAALAARQSGGRMRQVPASQVRYVLHEQLQFVEGDRECPRDWQTEQS
jgi:hypothetical protein